MSVSTIKSKIRNLITDNTSTGKDLFTYTSSKVFSLSEERISDVTAVYKNDVEVSESGNWSYSSSTNKLTFDSGYSITTGDTIQVDYTYYAKYSDTELLGYIQSALSYISIYQYKTFEYQDDDINPEPSVSEEYLIATVARIIIEPDNKTIKMPDMSIIVSPKALPTEDMIKQVVASFKKNCHGVFSVIDDTKIII